MRKNLKGILLGFVVLGGAAALVGGLSTALFTDTAQIQNSTFSTGSVDLRLTDNNETNAQNLANTELTLTGMVPGSSVRPVNGVTVINNGTLQLRYALYANATDADSLNLKDALEIEIREPDSTTANVGESPVQQCDDFDGTVIRANGANFDGAASAGTFVSLFGNSAAGSNAGDRTLNSSANEVICVTVQLPTGATGPQGATTTLIWEFRGEQTVNN